MGRLEGCSFYRVVPDPQKDLFSPADQCPFIYHNVVQWAVNNNMNALRIHCGTRGTWGYFTPSFPTAQEFTKLTFAECKAKGIKTIILANSDQDDAHDFPHKADVILNVNGLGDQWIADFTQMIIDLQPDGIEVMNEPPNAELSKNPNLTFAAYRAFVIRMCQAFRTAKPDIILLVDGCPFYDLTAWAAQPLPFSDVYYCVHFYYSQDMVGLPYYQFATDYAAGNLAIARNELFSYLLNTEGLQTCINAGLQIHFSEIGSDMTATNFDAFLKDMWDFGKQYAQGFFQFSLAPNPPDTFGILTTDWSALNVIGLLWQKSAPKPTPTTPFPTAAAIIAGIATLSIILILVAMKGGGK